MSNVQYVDMFDNMNVKNWFLELFTREPFAFLAMTQADEQKFTQILGAKNKKGYWEITEEHTQIIIVNKTNGHTVQTFYFVKYYGKDFNKDGQIGTFLVSFLNRILMKLTTHQG